jgi:hypothetical protein
MEADIVALYRAIIESNLQLSDKKEFLNEVRKLRPASENRWNFRWVMIALALIAISSPLALITQAVKEIPAGMLALSSTAVGALAAFITSGLKKG